MKVSHYHDLLRQMPCVASGQLGVHLHHVIGGSVVGRLGVRGRRKHSDWLVIPLTEEFHQGQSGIHRIGVITWEALYGRQVDHIERLGRVFGVDPFAMAAGESASSKANRRSKASEKIVPRSAA